ncbi:hypothetical protein KIPB_007493 [Kipferlia bialata]|uniref:Uncharacterized protein n=1 Tax=Kipferlia bialata TaxID=797122 RepID=A0A9K3GK31_9EUKA|nr:hypothetical protein KIPB_007493 [Kipferlia bialata]|eukprot:g7493.t1
MLRAGSCQTLEWGILRGVSGLSASSRDPVDTGTPGGAGLIGEGPLIINVWTLVPDALVALLCFVVSSGHTSSPLATLAALAEGTATGQGLVGSFSVSSNQNWVWRGVSGRAG